MRESNNSVYSRNIFSKVRGSDFKQQSNEDVKERDNWYNNDNDNDNNDNDNYEKEYDEEDDEDESDDEDHTDLQWRRQAEIDRQKRHQEENIKKQFLGIDKLNKNQEKGGLVS